MQGCPVLNAIPKSSAGELWVVIRISVLAIHISLGIYKQLEYAYAMRNSKMNRTGFIIRCRIDVCLQTDELRNAIRPTFPHSFYQGSVTMMIFCVHVRIVR